MTRFARISAHAFTALTGVVIAFQLALVAGAPWGHLTQGGRVEGPLPIGARAVALASAVLQLPPNLREVLMLRIWADMSFPAIAQLTGVPCATATSRYRYALDHLREQLAELQP